MRWRHRALDALELDVQNNVKQYQHFLSKVTPAYLTRNLHAPAGLYVLPTLFE